MLIDKLHQTSITEEPCPPITALEFKGLLGLAQSIDYCWHTGTYTLLVHHNTHNFRCCICHRDFWTIVRELTPQPKNINWQSEGF